MANFVFVSPYDQYALGAQYLSSVLKKTGHNVRMIILKEVFDNRSPELLKVDSGYMGETACCSDREYAMVRDLIRDFGADFIGISLASQCFGLSVWLSNRFRRDFPEVPIIWGGVDSTLHLKIGIEHCDFLAIGEAEDSLPELVGTLCSGGDPRHVTGFWTRSGDQVYRDQIRHLTVERDGLSSRLSAIEGKWLYRLHKKVAGFLSGGR
jgi:hypothetical protein